jgi:hypothetical protein
MYSHLSDRSFVTQHISELGWKEVLIFLQQLCNLVNGSSILIIFDIGKIWCLLCSNIDLFYLDWMTNKWYLISLSLHISLAFYVSDAHFPGIIIIIGINVVATQQFLERCSPFVFFLFHREDRFFLN